MLLPYRDKRPVVPESVFVADNAVIAGDVELGAHSSVWFGSVIRGDVFWAKIGERTNVQDLCALHVTKNTYPLVIGNGVTIGHRAVLHGCKVGDYSLIGMGSVILDDVELGERCMVGAGSVVPPGVKVPPRTLVLGVPAKPKRPLTPAELEMLEHSAESYVELAKEYLKRNRR